MEFLSSLLSALKTILSYIYYILVWTWPIIVLALLYLIWQNRRKKNWVEDQEDIVLEIEVPKNNEKGPVAAEMMFASLHGILKTSEEMRREGSLQEHISFEIVADTSSIRFYVWMPKYLKDFVEGQIYAQYPTAEIRVIEDYTKNIDIDGDGVNDCIAGCELVLEKPDIYPIKTFLDFEVDPLAGITGVLSKLEQEHEKVWAQILIKPMDDSWREKSLYFVDSIRAGKSPVKASIAQTIISGLAKLPGELLTRAINPPELSANQPPRLTKSQEAELTAIETKAAKLAYGIKIRIIYLSKNVNLAKKRLQAITSAFKQFNTPSLNGFASTNCEINPGFLQEYRSRFFPEQGYILNIEELASLFHMPHISVETPNIAWTSSKKGEPPANIPIEGVTDSNELSLFAETNFRGAKKSFGIKTDDRRRHMYIIGKSGMGKSKLLELLAISDINKGNGVGIIDPHGETVEHVLKHIPKHRLNDVVYFNPADKDFPIAFNALELPDPDFKESIASGFIAIFKKLFGWTWGPRLEHVLRHTVLALLDFPNSTMLGVVRMLTDKTYRKKVIKQIKDPVVKSFWVNEFATYNDRFATEAVAPILNKVGQFVASPLIRNIIGQSKSTIDLRDIMDKKKILLINLSSGKIGFDNSSLLGSLMITKLELAAMSRADIPEEQRNDFYLYVDEFQNFATESFAKILSEARKYRLDLIVANQYIAQMEETVRDAVFGNIGTLISFRVGAKDSEFLEKEFAPIFEANDLANLDFRNIYIKMGVDGLTGQAFSAKTLDVPKPTEDYTEEIIKLAREKFARPRVDIEEKIARWSQMHMEGGEEEEKDESFKPKRPQGGFKADTPNKVRFEGKRQGEAKKPQFHSTSSLRGDSVEPGQVDSHKEEERRPEPTLVNKQNPIEDKPKSEPTKPQINKEELKNVIKEATQRVRIEEKKEIVSEGKKPDDKEKETVNKKEEQKERVDEEKPADEKVEAKREDLISHGYHHRPEKSLKTITPENFKELKEIHPHERVEIADEKKTDPKEIKPGETVMFEEKE